MRIWMSRLLCLALMALPLVGQMETIAQTDDLGKPIRVKHPQRVISLYGSYAEAWMEAGGTLVGVTEDAVSERGMVIPEASVVGTTKEPNLEMILALAPDWVILSADIAAQVKAAAVLETAGVPCNAFRMDSWQDYDHMMALFTQQTGQDALYDQIMLPMKAEITEWKARAQSQESPTVLLLRAYSTGVKVKAEDNLAGVMLADLGADNLAGRHPSLLEELSLESIVAENPERIFVTIMGQDEQAAMASLQATLGQNPAWQAMDAVKAGRIYVLPKELFHYKPNSRWGESYAFLYKLLYEE